MINLFDEEFYPTPTEVIDRMMKDEDVWYKFNQEIAKSRGWSLPKKSEKKKNG